MPRHRIFATSFASIYPHYVAKAERKDHSKAEVDQVICWLTGYDDAGLDQVIADEVDLETFFAQAPAMNPNASLITGVICGIRVRGDRGPADAEDPLHGQAGRRGGAGQEDDLDPARQHGRRLNGRGSPRGVPAPQIRTAGSGHAPTGLSRRRRRWRGSVQAR